MTDNRTRARGRILCGTVIAVTVLASSSSGALEAARAAMPSGHPGAGGGVGRTQQPEPAQGEVIVPGGMRFIANAAQMRRVARSREDAASDFLAELAAYLSAPMVLDYAERVSSMVAELRALRTAMADIEARHPGVVPSLAETGTPAYAKAVELLDFLGFRVIEDAERIQLQRRVGDREARQRQMLGYLGVSVPLQSRLWAAGEPVVLDIEDDRVPLLLGAEAWNTQVFERELEGAAIFDAIVADRASRDVLAGYAALDAPTREWLFGEVGLAPLHDRPAIAAGFRHIAPYLRAVDGGLRLPGGDRDAWQAILGPWSDTTGLLTSLVTRDEGRAAHLWRALSLVPERRARYLLTLGHEAAGQRAAWAQTMYGAIRTPDFIDGIRWPNDVAELFVNLRLHPDGAGIAWPGGGRVWQAALADDDPLATEAALDALIERFAAGPDAGPAVDEALLREILRRSEPDRDEPAAIRKVVAVSRAIRYQPIGSMRRAIPLLYRNYRTFGRAYGFFVTPTTLPDGAAERLLWQLQQVDAIEPDEARIDAIRQLQASMMLLHRLLLNDLLTNDDRRALVDGFLDLPISQAAVAGGPTSPYYAVAVAEWWRKELVPAMVRGLQLNGWAGDPADLRSVVVTALVGRIPVAELEVDGIDYNFTAAATRGRRMYTHLLQQQQPSFESLFRLDEIAETLQEGAGEAGLADEIDAIVAALRAQMPPNIGDQEVTEALPVTIARDQLFARSDALTAALRAGPATPAQIASFRQAVDAYLGDALVGIVYALYMGDPGSFTYQQGHIAWLHRLIIAELGGGGPQDLFSPWAATAESWILDEGSRLHNSLYGAPTILARWNVEDMIAGGGARDPAAAEAWAAALAYIHLPSLTPEAQRIVAQRYELATSWIREAVAARNPQLTPSFWVSADRTAVAPRLADALRRLMKPAELQRFVDAVGAGREADALALVSDGNRYLLLAALDDFDREAPAAARWLVDQMVGMPLGRRGDYLGLMTPPPVPYGEAGDELADPLLYARLLDIRVRLAVLMQERGLPAGMHGRLLIGSMARILANMVPANYQPWRNLLAAIDTEVTEAALGQLVVDLAFADELTPTDPALALDALADTAGGGGPAGRTSTLGLPVDPQQYEAAFGAEVDMITVDIGAWDDNDNFITDLTLEDIAITRDGEPVTPAFLRLVGNPEPSIFVEDLPANVADDVVSAPRNFVLVADLLTTSPQDWERILLDVTEFVRAGIGVEDRLALVTIGNNGIPEVTHDFTIDHERVAETLEAQVGNSFATADRESSFIELSSILCDNGGCTAPGETGDISLCEPISTPRFYECITQQDEWEDFKFRMAQAQLGRWSIEASLNAERVMSAMTQVGSMLDLGDPYDRQKYIILLSSGFERQPGSIHQQIITEYASYSPSLNPMEVRTVRDDLGQKVVDLTEVMQRCRCTVYSLGTLGQSAFNEGSAELATSPPLVSRFAARTTLQDPLNGLARDTGGKPFFGSDMSLGFQDVLQDTRLRYVVGFTMDTPSADAESRWHELDVQINRPDVDEVRAREGFYWPRR